MKSSLGETSIRTDLVDGRNDEAQGDFASVAAIPDTEQKRARVPADGFHLWRNENLHFTLYLKGHGDSHTRKIEEPPK